MKKRGILMKLRTGDIAIIVLVVLLAISIWLVPYAFKADGEWVEVSHDGRPAYKLSLIEDKTVEVNGCTVEISGGAARVSSATCPDKICVKSGEISKKGEVIVCVPNRISIEVFGVSSYDALAG